MGSIGNFLKHYDFLTLSQSVTHLKQELYNEPNETWSQIGNKLCRICYYNTQSVAAVGADVAVYLFVSALRNVGCYLPPLSKPDQARPHDNVEFIDFSIQRALWNWDPSERNEFEEGLDVGLCEKWNLYQAIGEWSLASFYEHANEEGGIYKPSFLSVSEPLENGDSFLSVKKDFSSLGVKDRRAVLDAIYLQKDLDVLSSSAKSVCLKIRGLASLLHQGNEGFLKALGEFMQKRASQEEPEALYPTAPNLGSLHTLQDRWVGDVAALREPLLQSLADLPLQRQTDLLNAITGDRFPAEMPEDVRWGVAEQYPSFTVARLFLLECLKNASPAHERFSFVEWDRILPNGKTMREAFQETNLSSLENNQLRSALFDLHFYDEQLFERYKTLCQMAQVLCSSSAFTRAYQMLRSDLLGLRVIS